MDEGGDYNYVIANLPLHKAALNDDWEAAELIFSQDEAAVTKRITYNEETVLHIAVGTNSSHRFVENLVNLIASRDVTNLRTGDRFGSNALHFAAKTGNTRAARVLVEKDPEISQSCDQNGVRAVELAAYYARKETLVYLLEVTPDVVGENGLSPYSGLAGGELITNIVAASFFDVALYLVEKYPNLAWEKNRNGITALRRLAKQPKAFPSGRSRWFWEKCIYSCVPIDNRRLIERNLNMKTVVSKWNNISVPFVSEIGGAKLIHKQADQLMKAICKTIVSTGDYSTVWTVLGPATYAASVHGIHELIEECLACYPGLVMYKSEGSYFLFNAIKYRQVKVYNLVYQMTGHVVFAASNIKDGENALHLVARMASPHRVSSVTGAALQMQRELQWFKEIEKFVQPSNRDVLNKAKKTPQILFTEEHMELVQKGEKWMKDTSSSSMVVAALIFTVAFAAVFTVPGGVKDDGIPLFSKDRVFMLFAASDAVALFSSATSVLMFLAILTSRFAEDDFLYPLPMRLTIGLLSLLVSTAATMVTFSAALGLLLRQEVAWVAVPVGLMASVPVTFFALLQFPLLVELVISTYGPSIFHKQNNVVLY